MWKHVSALIDNILFTKLLINYSIIQSNDFLRALKAFTNISNTSLYIYPFIVGDGTDPCRAEVRHTSAERGYQYIKWQLTISECEKTKDVRRHGQDDRKQTNKQINMTIPDSLYTR